MKKYASLLIFLMLVALWGAFFSMIKFYIWGEQALLLAPDLQMIAGYLSLGGVFAYLVGGAAAASFLKKYYLCAISCLSALCVGIVFLFGFYDSTFLAVIVILLGFLYGLWNVVKSVLISIEIQKTGLPDTTVNAIVGIVFVVCIILGALGGSLLFEFAGRAGYLVICLLLCLTGLISLRLDYEAQTFRSLFRFGVKKYLYDKKQSLRDSLASFFPDLKYIVSHYSSIILTSAFLWSISTVVSQASIEWSVENFGMENSSATSLLLFSAVGAIVGNLISLKMSLHRWKIFLISAHAFALLLFLFPLLSLAFFTLALLAFLLGVVFGVASNLVDGYFAKIIGDEDKKEYGSSTHGLILSLVIFVMMFFSRFLQEQFGYNILMMVLGLIILSISWILFLQQQERGKA